MDEWVTGEHVDVPFTATSYKAKYRDRAHLGEGATQPSNILDTEIEAAKREWAGLVLSDEDCFFILSYSPLYIPPPHHLAYRQLKYARVY